MVAPGAGFRGGTLGDQKKVFEANKWVFGPKVCEDQKKKVFAKNHWVFSQNEDGDDQTK